MKAFLKAHPGMVLYFAGLLLVSIGSEKTCGLAVFGWGTLIAGVVIGLMEFDWGCATEDEYYP